MGKINKSSTGTTMGGSIGSTKENRFNQGRKTVESKRLKMIDRLSRTIEKRAKLMEKRRSINTL